MSLKCVICLVVTVLTTGSVLSSDVGTAVQRVRRAIGQVTTHTRFSRQIGEDISKVICVDSCMKEFKANLDTALGIDLEQVQKGFIDNTELFNGNDQVLPQLCDGFQSVKDCTEACGDFDSKADMMDAMSPLEYICVDNYDAFVAAVPCFDQSTAKVQEKCNVVCGGEDFMDEQIEKLDNLTKGASLQLGGMFNVMDTMCEYVQCRLTCQRPILNAECGSDEASTLMANLVTETMGTGMSKLEESGLGALMPIHCKQIAEGDYGQQEEEPSSSQSDEASEEIEFDSSELDSTTLEMSKYNLEMKVLERTNEKLGLEIEMLKLQLAKESSKTAD